MIEFILYVKDQQRSEQFYSQVLDKKPLLSVPGMTEFLLAENVKLGLMPEEGIAKIIFPSLPHPKNGHGIPRCELYLYYDDLNKYFNRAKNAGAKIIDEIKIRDWGDEAGYFCDPDGHVIALAKKLSE